MNNYVIHILVFLTISLDTFSQNDSNTKNWVQNILTNESILINQLYISKGSTLDSINFSDYYLGYSYNNINLYNNNKNNFIFTIKQKYEKRQKFKARFAFKSKEQILIILTEVDKSIYRINYASNKILNQYTEGLMGKLIVIEKDGILTLRSKGKHIDVKWITDLVFEYNKEKKNYYLLKAVAYSADLSNDSKPKIIKEIFTKKPTKETSIEETSYYDYFPFGFTDEFP